MDRLLHCLRDVPEHERERELIYAACMALIARLGQQVNPSQSRAGWREYIESAHGEMSERTFMMLMKVADDLLSVPA